MIFERNNYESDLHSNEHFLISSSENRALKKIQACTGFESMAYKVAYSVRGNGSIIYLFCFYCLFL